MLLSTMKAALAFPTQTLTSLSFLPFVSTMLPRYVKDCASSRTSPYSVSALLFLVLQMFTFSPNMAAVVSISNVFFLHLLLVV